MFVIVGLGNPGDKYDGTRHNIGFDVVDAIADSYSYDEPKKRHKGELFEGVIENKKTFLLKPTTFMNLSGDSVRALTTFYKISLDKIIVIHDDLDLALGKIKVKIGGGAGGHNGLRDIDAKMGKEYHRIRIGIGHPGNKGQVHSYVLKPFRKEEIDIKQQMIDAVERFIPYIIAGEREEFLNKVALHMQPLLKPKESEEKIVEAGQEASK